MVSNWVITYTDKWGILGDITHLLTIDPNFLGHPSKWAQLLMRTGL